MTNSQNAAIEEAAKLPTAEETLSQTYKSAGWRYDLSVLPTGCPHESLALDAIEAHTQAHTEGLRDQIADLERENDNYRLVYDSVVKNRDELRERVEELETWKESASTVLAELDLQAVGRKIGVKLGESVSKQLPAKIDDLLSELSRYRSIFEWIYDNTTPHVKSVLVERIHGVVKEALKK